MRLTDEEFSREFHARATFLGKIKLAIKEDRYTIWTRNPSNFPEEYLLPILNLPEKHRVRKKAPRRSGGPGFGYVLELNYDYREMGRPVPIYLKGYFSHNEGGKLVVAFVIQSLREEI